MTENISPLEHACPDHSCERCREFAERELFAERLEECLDDASGKWETLAMGMDVDVSLLSKWTGSRKNPMPAWRLVKFTEKVGPGLLRWIAQRCGYDLVRKDKAPKSLGA